MPRNSAPARVAHGSSLVAGFTLVELLVVVAVISLLAAILFPVFAQAREKARTTACLSNTRQIGMAYQMYAQDNDERLPLTQDDRSSWTDQCQPYIQNRAIYRCPSDPSTNWDAATQAQRRKTSYFLNFYMTGSDATDGGGYGSLARIRSPSLVIYLAESVDDAKSDHFHPMDWSGVGDASAELALTRHQGGANYAYVDGHSHWSRFDPLWFQDPSRGVVSGSFDPRQ